MKSADSRNPDRTISKRFVWFIVPCIILISGLTIIAVQWRSPSKGQAAPNNLQKSVFTNEARVHELGIVLLEITHPDGFVVVPAEAILNDQSGKFVFVENFDRKHDFLRAAVVVVPAGDGGVRIVHGLLPGDNIVVKGATLLRLEPSLSSKAPETNCS